MIHCSPQTTHYSIHCFYKLCTAHHYSTLLIYDPLLIIYNTLFTINNTLFITNNTLLIMNNTLLTTNNPAQFIVHYDYILLNIM